ncbi:MAG: hypothetical protein QOG12_785 [Verrucomicrobiota bacterium]
MSRNYKKLVPVAILAVVGAALFALPGEAQQKNPTTAAAPSATKNDPHVKGPDAQWGTPVAFAISDAVRDMPDAPRNDAAGTDTEVSGEEKNPENVMDNKTEKMDASGSPLASADGALQGAKVILSEAPSPPSLTFDGLADTDNTTAGAGIVAPSDQNLDVGPNDVVQTVNSCFRIWDKNGNAKTAPKLMSTLFKKMGGVCATQDHGDPVVLYDRMANRWFLTQFSWVNIATGPFHQCVAVSTTSDPQSAYFTYDFQTPNDRTFPDYGKFGVWPDAYYMTVNQFLEPAQNFVGVGYYALERSKMLIGDPTAKFIYFDLNLTVHPEGVNSSIPGNQNGLEAPPAGAPNVFAYLISDEFEDPGFNIDAIKMYNFHADFTTPANSTLLERPESPLVVAPYDPRVPNAGRGAKQPPPATNNDALDVIRYHLMYPLQYRNRAGVESLVASTTVNVSGVNPTTVPTFQAGVRYFELHKTTPNGAYFVYDNATFSPEAGQPAAGLNRFMPSAALDNKGNLAVSYSVSSTTVFPSIRYAGRDFNGISGLANEQTLFNGSGSQIATTNNRWGDYQSVMVDPTDDCTFWTNNQYYAVTSGFNWRTRIGRFKFPSCTPPAQGTLAGTITACDGGAPIAGAVVQVSNGFSATTLANGTYTLQLAPGTYTVTVSNGPRNCTAVGPFTVTITDAGTVTQNACLAGTARVVVDPTFPGDPAVATLTGGNGNGFFDPNECNNVVVTAKNLGCAPGKAIKAVLSTNTPGVVVTQPNSAYADMAIDASGGNSPAFKVSTAPNFACGTPIVFTLTTTFTGGSSTSTFTINTCGPTPVLPTTQQTGSLDPTDLKTVSGRLGRDGVTSVCGVNPKACPGALANSPAQRSYDQLVFPNIGGAPACVTVTLTSAGGINLIAAAYANAFNPADFCQNYLGDPGGSNNGAVPWNVVVPPLSQLVVVVMEVNPGTVATPYTVSVSGLQQAPAAGGGVCAANLTTQVNASTVAPGQASFDTATLSGAVNPSGTIQFRLFGPNNATCSGSPIFTSVQSVAGNGSYSSTSFTPTAPGTYNWVAAYSGDGTNPAVATACGDANETFTVAAPSPTPTPTATPTQLLNVSTRARVETGAGNEIIGGFIVTGSGTKNVIIRGLGPSLQSMGITDFMINPTLELHPPSGPVVFNQDWRDTQQAQIKATGIPPLFDVESAIVATVSPGAYTVILKGLNNGTGLGLIEVYDLQPGGTAKLANLSTRASVKTGPNVMIGGFIIGNGAANTVVRALGPSLTASGVPGALPDPTLELRDGDGALILSNDDWQDNAAQSAALTAAGMAPPNAKESAVIKVLPPGAYTAVVQGKNGTANGVGLVEIYNIP